MTAYDLETQRLRDFRNGFASGAALGVIIAFWAAWSFGLVRAHNQPPIPVFRSPSPELRKSDLREPAGSYFVDGVEFCRI